MKQTYLLPHCVYMLFSEKDHLLYIGYSGNLAQRVACHNSGGNKSTSRRGPLKQSIQNYGLLIAILLVSYGSKIAGGFIGGRLAGLKSRTSLTLGIGLNARGIMELVIANIAYNAGLISTEIFSILVLMGILTTLTTPYLLKRAFGKV